MNTEERHLIVGLGNPGKTYANTRHNIGFRIIASFAQRYGITFRPSLVRAKGSLGEGRAKEKKVLLLMPLTYMNESGLAVRRCSAYYKVPAAATVVVADDVALPFGQLRFRTKGSSGGHNGLKSVEAHLGTQEYPRLRVGVGNREDTELADYVLGEFTGEEQRLLSDIVERSVHALELWLTEGAETAMQEANK